MEALHCQKTTGELTGGQEQHQSESLQQALQRKSPSQTTQDQLTPCPRSHSTVLLPKLSRRHNPDRKRLRHQRQSIVSDTVLEHNQETTESATVSSSSSGVLHCTEDPTIQFALETQEDNPKQKRERKPQKPGKYVCTYCGRACAKPSVLQKHIRSHTGERPYPCAPCGFSFKTKSNLYKHRKSHTHRVKAGLTLGEPKSLEEQVTESEDETRQLSSASTLTNRQNNVASGKGPEADVLKDSTGASNDSYAVKKRLALRLSRGKHGSHESSDEKTSLLKLGSRGSTESGYFSRSESTEQSQDSPPNTSAKSYAEIILGKYGHLGQLQKMSSHHNQHPPGHEEKNISFTVPKKQVIDHITKLITINEAVVDTSKIDSVKPRRFSLSRKNSSEAQKSSSIKEHFIHSPKSGDLGYKTTGSISMGVPCEKFHNRPLIVEQPLCQIPPASMVRSLSLPSASSSLDASSTVPCKFRQTQSFDEQPSETQVSRRFRTLRRQPAIEIPVGAEPTKEEQNLSHTISCNSATTVSDHEQHQPQPYECEACGTGCKDWEGYKKHKQNICHAHYPQNEMVMSPMESSQLSNHAVRAGISTMRKRRKEDSFESDDLSNPSLSSSALVSGQCKDEITVAIESLGKPTLQTCSVIQHTSLFEKQDSSCHEYQSLKITNDSPLHKENHPMSKTKHQQQSVKVTGRKLVHQNNVQVPEILVTEDLNISPETSKESNSADKKLEKLDDFHWPQRSPSLAQLPIEKLPPKKKRLRLAEAAQSSGDSSFDSMSLPRSPSQDSSASYASSRSTSFEEPSRPDMEIATSTAFRRSRAPQMLTVPGMHHQREMRRSASEQAPHDPQPNVVMAETRSKSFDYSCLSPERSAIGWKERRKCLLRRHAVIRDQDDEEGHGTVLNHSPEHVSSDRFYQENQTSVYGSRSSSPPLSSVRLLDIPEGSQCKEIFSKWKLSQNIHLKVSTELSKTAVPSVDNVINEASYVHADQVPPRAPQTNPSHGPTGAARAHYLPVSTGLKLEIPLQHQPCAEVPSNPPHIQQRVPIITSCSEELRPFTSPAVVVRLQTDTFTPACAIYTTLSQSISQKPNEAFDDISPNINLSTVKFRKQEDPSLDPHPWSDEAPRFPGSSGNKRMLSPSNSIELHPELQQQQKRVKEEERKEVGCATAAALDTPSHDFKQETQSCLPDGSSPTSRGESSFPSLLSSTCNSWCYLNYIKPNPSTLDEQKPSVYSSWSTSGYDPNPPGLCSKTVLSLLHCKQRLTSSIYTTSSMMVGITDSMEDENSKQLCSTEVYSSPPYCRNHERMARAEPSTDDMVSSKTSMKTEKIRQKQEVHVCSINDRAELGISERRSQAQAGVVCGECDRKCRSEPRNPAVHSEESRASVCKLCSSTLKAAVSARCGQRLTPEVCEEEGRSHQKDTHGEQPANHEDLRCRDLDKDAAQQHNEGADKLGMRDEGSRSTPPKGSFTNIEKAQAEGQRVEHTGSPSLPFTTKDGTKRSSASTRRALFARRRLNASASASSGASHSPCSQSPSSGREPSPPRSPSPRPHQSSAPPPSLSPSTRPVSSLLNKAASPVSGQTKGPYPAGLPGSPASQSQTCSQPQHPRPAAVLPGEEIRLVPIIGPHPTRPRGTNRLLSHLPLHSQQPSRTPSLLIPIGGIHMVQPRSTLPLYSLVASQAGPSVLSDATKGKHAVQPRQDAQKETLGCGRGGPRGPQAAEQTPAGDKSLTVQQPSTSRAGTERTERHVYTKGQDTAASSQKRL